MADQRTATEEAPIFVVGVPRSGTTLLAAMLGAHSRLDCGPESRFFAAYRDLPPSRKRGLIEPSDWPARATRFMCGLTNQGHPVHELFGLEREAVQGWLERCEPSVAAMLESLTAQRAARHGKTRWVEKTPRHLLALPLIRRSWPQAPIVRIVRDPRDVALSLSRVPFFGGSLVSNLVHVDNYDRDSRAFLARDRLSFTLRYEDLVTDPVGQLQRLCHFLGEEYQPGMIDSRQANGGVAAEHEWWKSDVAGPIDTSRIGRWRTEMPPEVQGFAGLHLAGYLEEHGYEGARPARRHLAVVPVDHGLGAKHEGMLLDLAARGIAIGRPAPRSAAQLAHQADLVFFGVRGQLDPMRGRGLRRRLTGVGRLALSLARRRLRGRAALWVRHHTRRSRRPTDPGELIVLALLRLLARRVTSDRVAGLVDGDLR